MEDLPLMIRLFPMGLTLGLSSIATPDLILKICQSIGIIIAAMFTFSQFMLNRQRKTQEKTAYGILIEAQKKCIKAQVGDCPVSTAIEEMHKRKL